MVGPFILLVLPPYMRASSTRSGNGRDHIFLMLKMINLPSSRTVPSLLDYQKLSVLSIYLLNQVGAFFKLSYGNIEGGKIQERLILQLRGTGTNELCTLLSGNMHQI